MKIMRNLILLSLNVFMFLCALGCLLLAGWFFVRDFKAPECVERSESYEICRPYRCHEGIKEFTRTDRCVTFDDNVVTHVICGNFTIESVPAIKCENRK